MAAQEPPKKRQRTEESTKEITEKTEDEKLLDDILADQDIGIAENTKNFRLQAKKIFLTYKGHPDKKEYEEWFNQRIKETKFLRIAHEKASAKTNYEHCHILIEMSSAPCFTNPRKFDYPMMIDGEKVMVHPHIRIKTNAKAWKNAMKYLTKEDKENEDLLETVQALEKKEKKLDTAAAYALVKTANCYAEFVESLLDLDPDWMLSMTNIKHIWEALGNRHKPKVFREPNWPWQQEILTEMDTREEDDRIITWCYNKVGNLGKSTLMMYLAITRPLDWGFMINPYGYKDGATVVSNLNDAGWNGTGLVIDLTRGTRDKHSRELYDILEALKAGAFMASKYSGKSFFLRRKPHVLVFANWAPRVGEVSFDRWDIRKILPNRSGLVKESFEKFATLTELEEQSPGADEDPSEVGKTVLELIEQHKQITHPIE